MRNFWDRFWAAGIVLIVAAVFVFMGLSTIAVAHLGPFHHCAFSASLCPCNTDCTCEECSQ